MDSTIFRCWKLSHLEKKTQLESMLTRVQCIPELPKSAVRGRHVRCFESTWQISNRSIYSSCAPLFVLSGVSGARFLELEVWLRKKQRRQVLRIPKGAHTKHLHVTTSAAHWVLTAKAAQLELMTWGRARLGYTVRENACAHNLWYVLRGF